MYDACDVVSLTTLDFSRFAEYVSVCLTQGSSETLVYDHVFVTNIIRVRLWLNLMHDMNEELPCLW